MAQKKTARHSKSTGKTGAAQGKKAKSPLDQANADGWESVEIRDISAVIMMTLDKLDRQAIENVSPYLGDDWQENLQEIILTRFDIANAHRHAFSTLPDYLLRHPQIAAKLSRNGVQAQAHILDAAGLSLPRHLKAIAVPAFGLLHLALVEQWRRDTSADMAKTMAATAKYIKLFSKMIDLTQAVGSKREGRQRRSRRV